MVWQSSLREVGFEDEDRRRVAQAHGLAGRLDVLDDHFVSLTDICE